MFEFTRNFYKAPGNGGGSESIGPGTVIIPEQTVETLPPMEGADPSATLDSDYGIGPDKLLINFNGTDYEVKAVKDGDVYVYDYPLGAKDDRLFRITLFPPQGWVIVTPNQGTYTISAKIPEEKSTPKVFTFPKGRTIVSELSRLNKAFGTVSKKKTIIGQLSDIADAAEAGKIGGGSGEITYVHISTEDGIVYTADKSYDEILNIINSDIPVSVIYGPAIYLFNGKTKYTIRFSVTRVISGHMFVESFVFSSDGIQLENKIYELPSSDGV